MSQVSDLTFAILNVLEGLRFNAYQDVGGKWTISYGHTPAKEGETCTLAQARLWLEEDLNHLFNQIPNTLPLISQAAYASFGYNCGITALNHVLSGKAKLNEFVHVGNRVIDDLVRRRAFEQALIDTSKEEGE